MNEKRSKILGTVIFLLLISTILFLIFSPAKKISESKIEMIEVAGNALLNETDYLSYTKLNEVSFYKDLPLSVVKDRFEKHPYIKKADVEFTSKNKITVTVSEHRISAVVFNGADAFFISENFQLLPLYSNTKFVDYPIISNPKNSASFKSLAFIKDGDIIQSFKIIEAARLANLKLLEKLSEINLRNGGDVVLTFSGLKPPVIFGRNNEAEKLVYLAKLLSSEEEGKDIIESSEYIDLRFADEVYLGRIEKTSLAE